jgi:hypothetical protein
VASIEDIVAGLRAGLDLLATARQHLTEGGAASRRAAARQVAVLAGSTGPEAAKLARLNAAIQENVGETNELADRCATAVNTMIDRLRGDDGQPSPGPISSDRAGTTLPDTQQRAIEAAHRKLGKEFPGARTEGVWVRPDGTTERLSSGKASDWHGPAVAALTEIEDYRLSGALGTHVEAQFVTRMRQQGLTNAVLALDRAPCGSAGGAPATKYSCHRKLPKIIRSLLPPGSTLTVVAPTGAAWEYSETGRRRVG